MRLRCLVYLSPLLLLLIGCGTQYKYGEATYSTREEAAQAVRADTNALVAGVTPVSERLGGRALAVVPTRTVMQAHGVRAGSAAKADSVGYIVDVLEVGYLGMVEGVRNAKVFDDVTLLRHDNSENALYDNYDYKLWLFSGGPTTWQWYLSRKGVSEREPISADAGLEGVERINSFNENVVRAGERLGADTIPLAAPTQ